MRRMKLSLSEEEEEYEEEEEETHQLLTCKLVRPDSTANFFFSSSEGYGCWNKVGTGCELPCEIVSEALYSPVIHLW